MHASHFAATGVVTQLKTLVGHSGAVRKWTVAGLPAVLSHPHLSLALGSSKSGTGQRLLVQQL